MSKDYNSQDIKILEGLEAALRLVAEFGSGYHGRVIY